MQNVAPFHFLSVVTGAGLTSLAMPHRVIIGTAGPGDNIQFIRAAAYLELGGIMQAAGA